jgi:hypothetical protein
MKERAVETAEALKAAAEALGFAPDSDRFFTFVNNQFNAVYYGPPYPPTDSFNEATGMSDTEKVD